MENNTKPKVLIVDDVAENIHLLENTLKNEFQIVAATNGKKALELVNKNSDISTVLLDIKMPEMDGFEVCRILKSDEKTASIPIIFISVLSDTEDKLYGFKMGGADYITKPFKVEEVLARVRTHIKNYQLEHHLEKVVRERTLELDNAYDLLAKKEEQYRGLVERVEDSYLFYSHDIDGVFTYVSPSIKEILGYTQEEFLTHYTEYMTDNQVNLKVIESTEKALNGQSQTPYEVEMRHSNGTKCWLEITEQPVLDDSMKVIRIEGIARDITPQKMAEEALQLQIRDNKMILESAGEGIFGLDIDGNHTFVNPAAASMLGYTEKELLGKHSHATWHYKHQDGKPYPDEECPIYATLKSGLPVYLGEDYFIRKDGSQFPVTFTSQPMIEDGNVTGAVVSFIDISEKIELEKKLRVNEDIMINQSKHASMGELIGMIAHQWKQPLSIMSMSANSQLADIELEDELKSERLKKDAHMTLEQIKYMSETIDDFRSFFKPNKEKEYSSIKKVLHKSVNIIGKSLENNGIEFQITKSSATEFLTYPNELSQVFINIINNAKDAIVNNKIENGKIIVNIEEDASFIKSTVSDNGGGIPKEIMEKIGTRYFTTKGDNGTGLGLYMSKLIVENKMDGEFIWYNSEDGACFCIKIPK